jgi:hypothetical protein
MQIAKELAHQASSWRIFSPPVVGQLTAAKI